MKPGQSKIDQNKVITLNEIVFKEKKFTLGIYNYKDYYGKDKTGYQPYDTREPYTIYTIYEVRYKAFNEILELYKAWYGKKLLKRNKYFIIISTIFIPTVFIWLFIKMIIE